MQEESCSQGDWWLGKNGVWGWLGHDLLAKAKL